MWLMSSEEKAVSEDQILSVSHREEATEATVKRILSESHGKKTYKNTT